MCIIAYAPQGVQISDATIVRMFRNNPDGAGVMWKTGADERVQIVKGLETADELLKVWHNIPAEYEKALHCRIATSGKISVACCHPFPIRDRMDTFKTRSCSCDSAVMHNGVIRFCTPQEGMRANYSDTMVFASKVLAPLRNSLNSPVIKRLLEQSIDGSRLLIFRQFARPLMFGYWVLHQGVYYSNSTFRSCNYYFEDEYYNENDKYWEE